MDPELGRWEDGLNQNHLLSLDHVNRYACIRRQPLLFLITGGVASLALF